VKDITFEVRGNAVTDVSVRFTKSGDPVASFRIAVSTGHFDKRLDSWVETDTHFFDVSCWRTLAHNVAQSVRKGEPLIVHGRLRSREVQRSCGETGHTVRYFDLEATTVGHDLGRGVSSFTRVKREAVLESERRALAEATAVAGLGEHDPISSEPAA
jgi:single-strand DNA-binding protein